MKIERKRKNIVRKINLCYIKRKSFEALKSTIHIFSKDFTIQVKSNTLFTENVEMTKLEPEQEK